MDKLVFCKRFMLWTAIIVAVVIAVIGLCFGKVVEATLAEEIGEWIVMGIFVIGIFEVFAFILARRSIIGSMTGREPSRARNR